MSEEKKSFTPRANVTRRSNSTTVGGRRFGTSAPRGNGKPSFGNKPNQSRGNFRKPAQRKPLTEQEKRILEEKKIKRQRLDETYEVLHAKFPKAIDRENIKPLAVDVHKQLFELTTEDGPLRKSAIRQFLASYIRNDDYHAAALKHKKRFNLEGEAVADIDEAELQYHRQNMRKKAPVRKPAFNKKPGFGARKPGAHNRQGGARRPGNNDDRRNFKPNNRFTASFTVGQKVIAGENRAGTVKEVIGDRVRVTLDNGITLLFAANQVRKA
ncbi:hypothetical protein CKF54_03155 [Psittacicella hinzii]|uniref:ProQ/FinO domain-containing protein n=1 Tax=Psittacicella hinzii TaxID=2028575 RepID=A0A3A1Y4N4_9GAMM|nr:ProQ/FINO family protein [Psittacicella hinzii]RIY33203.1 hypothetical protein CKF54_03155 [Psittacicella hinzii]